QHRQTLTRGTVFPPSPLPTRGEAKRIGALANDAAPLFGVRRPAVLVRRRNLLRRRGHPGWALHPAPGVSANLYHADRHPGPEPDRGPGPRPVRLGRPRHPRRTPRPTPGTLAHLV